MLSTLKVDSPLVINISKILSIYVVLHAFFSASSLGTNDDSGMALLASGGFGGTPSPRLVYINSGLGYVLASSYQLLPSIPAYSIFALGTNIVSILLLIVSVSAFLDLCKFPSDIHNIYAGVLLCISLFILQQNLLEINYTKTAFTASFVGLVSLQLAIVASKKPLIYISIFVCCLGFVWRDDAFILAVLISLPTLVKVSVGRYQYVTKGIGVLFSLIFSIYLLDRLSYKFLHNWSTYMEYNSARGKIHGSRSVALVVKNFGIEKVSESLNIPESVLLMFFNWFFEPEVLSKRVLENLEGLVQNSSDPLNSIILFFPWQIYVIAFVTSLIIFINLKIPSTNYALLGCTAFIIFCVGTFLITTIRLPSTVEYGLILGFLSNGMMSLLVTRRWSVRSNFRQGVFRKFLLLRWCFLIGVLVLICRDGKWSDKNTTVLNQKSFSAFFSEFSNQDFPKPIFGIPRELELGTENPFKTFGLYDLGIFATTGWIMGSPIERELLDTYGASDRVSLALIDGHILLANMSLESLQFESYFFDVYGRCGSFTPVHSPNIWDLGLYVAEPCP